jgi:hypothetical protein
MMEVKKYFCSEYQLKTYLSKPTISERFPDTVSKQIFSILDIDIHTPGDIRVIDEIEEDELYLIHYLELEPISYHVRGIIFHVHDDMVKQVCSAFPFTDEIMYTPNLKLNIDASVKITTAIEGTIYRMFQGPITGKFYFSTHKRIDGRKSRWSGPSFGQIFDELWQPTEHPFEDYIDTDKCNVFRLSHPENRLVEPMDKPKLTLLAQISYCDNKPVYHDVTLKQEHPNVSVCQPKIFDNDSQLHEYVNTVNRTNSPGLVLYYPITMQFVRIVYSEYVELRNIRGSDPNLKLCYLTYFLDGTSDSCDKLRELFTEKTSVFDELENDYSKLPKYLLHYYTMRQNGVAITLPKEEHYALMYVKRNRTDKSILAQLQVYINGLEVNRIHAMIKHMNAPNKFITIGE